MDILGASSGLLRAKNKTDILINLDQEDTNFLWSLESVLEQLELEDDANSIRDLGDKFFSFCFSFHNLLFSDKICNNLTGPGSSLNPGDSFCFVDVENYFLKTEILDKEREISILYDVFSEIELEDILSNIKESSFYIKKFFLKTLRHILSIYLLFA